MKKPKPELPLPDPLRGADEGTFAHDTVKVRLPDIVRRTIQENDFPPEIEKKLEALIDEIENGLIRPIYDHKAPDIAAWDRYVAPYLGQTWYEAPWFFVEHYLFRRILEATGYFQSSEWQFVDPYLHQKRTGLENAQTEIQALAGQVSQWLKKESWDPEDFAELLNLSLWGNQADLSLWPAEEEERPDHTSAEQARQFLLVDDSNRAASYLGKLEMPHQRIDIIEDNAGLELVGDLCLADYVLSSGCAGQVLLHLKAHPTYVSDAMASDVRETVNFFIESSTADMQRLGARLNDHLARERLILQEDFYWNSPLLAWEMPLSLRDELSLSALVISKGDANYRRFLGDLHWEFTISIEQIISYFPAPLLLLRTLKSEVVAGLQPDQVEEMPKRDKDWLTGGRWGVVQFVE